MVGCGDFDLRNRPRARGLAGHELRVGTPGVGLRRSYPAVDTTEVLCSNGQRRLILLVLPGLGPRPLATVERGTPRSVQDVRQAATVGVLDRVGIRVVGVAALGGSPAQDFEIVECAWKGHRSVPPVNGTESVIRVLTRAATRLVLSVRIELAVQKHSVPVVVLAPSGLEDVDHKAQ